jgi:hypothetical protein
MPLFEEGIRPLFDTALNFFCGLSQFADRTFRVPNVAFSQEAEGIRPDPWVVVDFCPM